jgi:SAM-dependent methyltransferase
MSVNAQWERLVRGGFFAEYSYEARRRYQKSSAALDLPRSAWILEVGCGTGRYHRLLRELGYTNVVSCDLTSEHILRARELNPDGLFVIASGEHLPFRSGVFDAVVSNAAIEHFADPARGMREFARVAAPDARFVITSDCYSWRVLQLCGLYRSKMPIDRTLSWWGFRRLFSQAGLEIRAADAWGITHYLRRVSRALRSAEQTLARAAADGHWSNRPARTRAGTVLRSMTLDENLFVLARAGSRGVPLTPSGRGRITLDAVLACPACGADLTPGNDAGAPRCGACGGAFDAVSGIPVLHAP